MTEGYIRALKINKYFAGGEGYQVLKNSVNSPVMMMRPLPIHNMQDLNNDEAVSNCKRNLFPGLTMT
jgi:hypothetical protein